MCHELSSDHKVDRSYGSKGNLEDSVWLCVLEKRAKNLHSCSYERGVKERLDPWAFYFISSPLPRCGRERSSRGGHQESSQGHPITVLHFYCLVNVLYEGGLRMWGEQKHLWAVPGQHLACGLGQMEYTTKKKFSYAALCGWSTPRRVQADDLVIQLFVCWELQLQHWERF